MLTIRGRRRLTVVALVATSTLLPATVTPHPDDGPPVDLSGSAAEPPPYVADARAMSAVTLTRITTGPLVSGGGFSFGHAWNDFTGDGCLDVIVQNIVAGQTNLLYAGQCDGTFTEITGTPPNMNGPSMSATWGDYDNDGDRDLFTANGGTAGPALDDLFRNDDFVTFTPITTGTLVTQSAASTATSWVDINDDGLLDLFVGRGGGSANRLYMNDGTDTFSNVVALPDASGTWGVSFADYDADGDMDGYCANWAIPNYLYRNDGGSLTRLFTGPLGGNERSLSASWGDIDNDGDLDLYVANSAARNRLYENTGSGDFSELLSGDHVTLVDNSESSCWADMDHDGDVDLLVSSGGNQSTGTNHYYENNGDGTFTTIATGEFVTLVGRYEAMTCADPDNDGDLDVLLSNYSNLNNVYYRNDSPAGSWLRVICQGTTSNRDGIGAVAHIKATISGTPTWLMRQVSSHVGHVSEGDRRLHFGLGDATSVDSLVVVWPSGTVDAFTGVAVNAPITVVEGSSTGIDDPAPSPLSRPVLAQNTPNPFNPTTRITYDLPSAAHVALSIYAASGQRITRLVDARQGAGRHTVDWTARGADGATLASGVYFYELEVRTRTGRVSERRSMVLMK